MDDTREEDQSFLQSNIPTVGDDRSSKAEEDNFKISEKEINFLVGLEKDYGLKLSNEDYAEIFNETNESYPLDPKTSEHDLSLMVEAAYTDGNFERNLKLPQDWQLVTTAFSKGYFGAALWNPNLRKTFIFHAATFCMFNILGPNILFGIWYLFTCNFKALKLHRYEPQIGSAVTFTKYIKNSLESKDTKLSFGGNKTRLWLANLTRFSERNLDITNHNGKEYFTLNNEAQQHSLPHNVVIKKDRKLILSDPNFAERISPKDEEFLYQEPFPSAREMALMSEAAYDDELSCSKYTEELKLKGWVFLTSASNNSWGNCYFGVAFWNPISHQVVVAHRGTVVKSIKNIMSILFVTDFVGVTLTQYVPQIGSAITFAEIIREAVQKHPSVRISFTGHSLGGWLAQITTFSLKCLRLRQPENKFFFNPENVGDFHPHTIAFDTPGCRQMLTKMKADFSPKYLDQIDLDKRLDISVYLSVPNLVNTSNHHLGTVYGFKKKWYGWIQKFNSLSRLLKSHAITNIVTAFDLDRPLSEVVHEVIDFPSRSDKRHHVQEYDGKTCTLRLFSTEELYLLTMLEILHDKVNMITGLPKIALDGVAYKLRVADDEDLNEVIKTIKYSIRRFKNIILSFINMHTYTITHTELHFKDSFGLNEFLSNSDQRVKSLVVDDFSVVSAIHSVLQKSNIETQEKVSVYLKWRHLETLLKVIDISTVLKMADVVLLECDPSQSSGFLDSIVSYIGKSKTYTGKCILITTCNDQDALLKLFKRYPTIHTYHRTPLEFLNLTEESQAIFLKQTLDKELPDIYSMDVFYQDVNVKLCIKDIKRCLITGQNTKFFASCIRKQPCIYHLLGNELENEFITADRQELIRVEYYAQEDITKQMNDFQEFCKDNLSYKVIWLEHFSGTTYICKRIFNIELGLIRKLQNRWFLDKSHVETALVCNKLIDTCVFVTEEKENSFPEEIRLLKNVYIVKSVNDAFGITNSLRTAAHVLKCTNSGHLNWIKSTNSVENLKPHILWRNPTDCSDYTDEDNFVSTMNKLVIIADKPGMGKTTTCMKLLSKLKNCGRIYFNLKSCIKEISSLDANPGMEDVIQFLVKHVAQSQDTLGISLLRNTLRAKLINDHSTTPLTLLFDGFDELPKLSEGIDLHSKLVKFIKFLSENTTANVWVTTRTHSLCELQEQLPVFATTFLKISESEQKQYLKYHWCTILRLQLNNHEKLEEELGSYVEEMYQTAVTTFNESIIDIMGIPLLVRMLLEVARPKYTDGCEIDKSVFKLDNVVTLYDEFVELKFKIYFTDKGASSLWDFQNNELKRSLTEKLEDLAFSNHFPIEADNFVSHGEVEYARLGLIHKVHNARDNIEFMHRTFQEFFCARKLLRCITSKSVSAGTVEFLLTEVLLRKRHKVIRFFLNHIIEKSGVDPTKHLIDHVQNIWMHGRHKLFDKVGRSCLYVAALEGLQNLMKFLVAILDKYAFKLMMMQTAFGYTPLAVAMKYLDKSFVMQLKESFTVDQQTQIVEATVLNIRLPLLNRRYRDIYVDWGLDVPNVNLMRNYLDNNFLVNPDNLSLIEERLWSNEFFKGKALFQAADMGYVQTTELLVSRMNYLDNYDSTGKTALLVAAARGHFDIIDILLREGASVQILDFHDHKSLLHYAAGNAKSLESISRIGKLIKATFLSLKPETAKDKIGQTILHCLIIGYENNPDTVQPFCELIDLLLRYEVKINEEDEMGKTPVMHASNKLLFEVVEHLIMKGANVMSMNGRTALVEMLEFNLFKTNCDIISKVGKYLIDNGANVLHSDKNGVTALHLASAVVLPDLVKRIISKEVNVNAKCYMGWTPLHYVLTRFAPDEKVQSEKFKIVKILVENGAEVNITNDYRLTPLEVANHVTPETVQFLKSKDAVGKAIEETLHVSTLENYYDIVERYFQLPVPIERKGVSIRVYDNEFNDHHINIY